MVGLGVAMVDTYVGLALIVFGPCWALGSALEAAPEAVGPVKLVSIVGSRGV